MNICDTAPICLRTALMAGALLSLYVASAVYADAVVYLDEAAFLDAIAALGRTAYHEGFETESVWGGVRSTIAGGQFTAPSISHQGMRWSANNLSSEITTGEGPARNGTWGFYALPHGSYTEPDPGADCLNPGECGDGWRAASLSTPLIAIGGWIETNTPFAKLGLFLGHYPENPVDFGETCDPPGSENCSPNDVVTTTHQFWGVIDESGFSGFEFRELEGKLEIDGGDLKFIFADDFWFAFRDSDPIFANGFE